MFEIEEVGSWTLPMEGEGNPPRVHFTIPSATELRRFESERRQLYMELGIEFGDAGTFIQTDEAMDFLLGWTNRFVTRLEDFTVGGKTLEWDDDWLTKRGLSKHEVLARLGSTAIERMQNFHSLCNAVLYGMTPVTKKKSSTGSEKRSVPTDASAPSAKETTNDKKSSTSEHSNRPDTPISASAQNASTSEAS